MKPDFDKIIDFLDNLAKESWLGSARSRWVKYVFHYTDIRNAVEILKGEKLLCRTELERTGKMLAEVVIPNELDLSALKFIVCRSPAEKESLLYLLPTSVISKWGSKILVDTKSDFYNRNWAFIQTVQLNSKNATFDFSPDAIATEPFVLTAIRRGYEEKILRQENFRANKTFMFEFPRDIWKYEIELRLDNNLAFIGSYDGSDDIPF